MAPTCGELCDRRRPATSEATVAHGKPYAAADMLQGPVRPTLPSAAPHYPRPRYTLSHPLYPPTTSLFGPSNSRHSPLFAHDFSLNYYKTINKITKAHHLAWHQQVCHPASRRGSDVFFLLSQGLRLGLRKVSPLAGLK